jgi:hypothetical protein
LERSFLKRKKILHSDIPILTQSGSTTIKVSTNIWTSQEMENKAIKRYTPGTAFIKVCMRENKKNVRNFSKEFFEFT